MNVQDMYVRRAAKIVYTCTRRTYRRFSPMENEMFLSAPLGRFFFSLLFFFRLFFLIFQAFSILFLFISPFSFVFFVLIFLILRFAFFLPLSILCRSLRIHFHDLPGAGTAAAPAKAAGASRRSRRRRHFHVSAVVVVVIVVVVLDPHRRRNVRDAWKRQER